jgi:hypothetical protein
MHHLAINGPHRREAMPAGAAPSRGSDDSYDSYVQAHVRTRPILTACAVWGAALLCYFILLAPARGAELPPTMLAAQPPAQAQALTAIACYELVQDAGRMIAWARWEQGFSLEKTRSAPFPPNTPPWMVALVQEWITDAYQWQATDEQVLQWAAELGSVENLPHAADLNKHETIAIWMRRIARQCTARSA